MTESSQEDRIQQVAEEFCRLLNNYEPRRGALDRYAYLALRNALHRSARTTARERARQARQVAYDTVAEEVRDA